MSEETRIEPQNLAAEGGDPSANAPEPTAPASVRERILQRFTLWLDEALAGEAVPSGIPAELVEEVERKVDRAAEDPADLYSLWSAMTVLSQEVKLQGRTFKDLSETLAPIAELKPGIESALRAEAQLLAEVRAWRAGEEKAAAAEIKRRAWGEFLGLLADLRDRLERGLESARGQTRRAGAVKPGMLARLFVRQEERYRALVEATEALVDGYQLTLDRLNEEMERLGVRPIECLDLPFDPHRMRAVELEVRDDVLEGTVIGVHRTGYEWNGEVFRPAEVKVARGGSEGSEEDDHGAR